MTSVVAKRLDERRSSCRWHERISIALSVLAIVIAVATLLGWAIGTPTLKSVVPGMPSMKVNTAIGVILIAISCIGMHLRARFGSAIVFVSLVAVSTLALMTLAEHAFDIDLRIDNAIILDRDSSAFPGRNSPATNIAFLGLATALGLLTVRRAPTVAQVLCLVVAFIPLTTLGGYVFRLSGVDERVPSPTIAISASVGVIVMCLAGIFARADSGLMGIVTSPTLAGSLARRLLPIALISPFVIGVLVLAGDRAELYSTAFGSALLITCCAFCFAAAVCVVVVVLSTTERAQALAERERARTERQVSQSEQQLRVAIETAKLASWTFDFATNHLDGSAQYWANFGLPPGMKATQPELLTRVHPSDRTRAQQSFYNSIRNGEDYHGEYRVLWPDGTLHWFVSSGRPVYDEAGKPLHVVGMTMDVTAERTAQLERERLFEVEREALITSERANRLKDEFLATLSHELRTPLSAILGWSQLLRRPGTKPDAIADGLLTIERNARAQSQIIGDLLDMSSIISGKVRLNLRPLDLLIALKSSVETVRPTAMAKGVELFFHADDTAHFPVAGDIGRLQQIFWNVLSNAIKFTPRGGGVDVRLERHESMWQIAVTDTGEGIPPDFLPFIFDRFRQADASTTRRHGGLGLGLAIVNQLIELHGGKASAASPGVGQGATVTLLLPIRVDPSSGPSQDTPTAGWIAGENSPRDDRGDAGATIVLPGFLRNRTILIVDDEPDARRLLEQLLGDSGATVFSAATADEALHHVATDRPDLLVSDIGMPIVDGYELIRRVRRLPPEHGGSTPAIALTAYAREEDRAKAASAGFQAHVAKPVEPTDLIEAIQRLLTSAR